MRQLTYTEGKVASMLWFAHFDMKIYGDAELLSCSHLVGYTSKCLFSKWN